MNQGQHCPLPSHIYSRFKFLTSLFSTAILYLNGSLFNAPSLRRTKVYASALSETSIVNFGLRATMTLFIRSINVTLSACSNSPLATAPLLSADIMKSFPGIKSKPFNWTDIFPEKYLQDTSIPGNNLFLLNGCNHILWISLQEKQPLCAFHPLYSLSPKSLTAECIYKWSA